MAGSIHLPDVAREPGMFDKAPARRAKVIAVGTWKTTRQGLSIVPEIQPGNLVFVNAYRGVSLTYGVGEELKQVGLDDILAVIEETPTTAITPNSSGP